MCLLFFPAKAHALKVPLLRVHIGDFSKAELNFPNGGTLYEDLQKSPISRFSKGKTLSLKPRGIEGKRKQNETLYFKGSEIQVNGRNYEGTLKVQKKNNTLRLINIVNLESYLLGVVGHEMSSSWPIEALKAQAVLARTYAMKKSLNRVHEKDKDFDLCSTIHCQVFGGKSEATSILNSVKSTVGQVITFQDNLVEGFYSGSCGGKTSTNDMAWGSKRLPYLDSKVDPYCVQSDNIYWKRTFPFSEIKSRLQNKYPRVGDSKKIRVNYGNESGRVENVTFSFPGGSYEIDGVELRNLMNVREFPSNIFKVSLEKNRASDPALKKGPNLFFTGSEDGVSIPFNDEKVYILDFQIDPKRGDRFVTLRAKKTYLQTSIKKFAKPTDSSTDNLVFLGRGNGHGIGLCQWGSKIQAELKKNYQEIIHFYFKKVEIKNLYRIKSVGA